MIANDNPRYFGFVFKNLEWFVIHKN